MKISNLSTRQKIIGLLILVGLVVGIYSVFFNKKSPAVQYQTSTVQKGTIVNSISTSGTISGGNNTTIYTSASGLVTKVYVKNGDKVTQGQKLADIKLDQDAQQKQTAAWASYLNSKNSAVSSKTNKLSLQSQLESARKSVLDAQTAVDNMNTSNKTYTDLEKQSIQSTLTTARQNFTVAEQKYNQADSSIASSQAQSTSSWLAYQQNSPTITAPANGVLSNFTLTPGISVGNLATSTSSNSSNATQAIGIIVNPNNQITASVNLTEIDVVNAVPGQKVTITMDAFLDKTFTGKILAINTNGQVSSGVTVYPTIIVLDSGLPNMYPNMAINAQIIIQTKNDVLSVPSSAIQTSNGQSVVKIKKDNQISEVTVETGISDSTNTEIISGLNEGDTVVTSTTNTQTNTSNSNSSATSIFGGSAGGQFRMRGN